MNTAQKAVKPDYVSARQNMIEGQLRPNGINDERILSAFEALPRETFVSGLLTGVAYVDEELGISTSRCLIRPLVLARLVQTAQVKSTDRVLDIGGGTGYSSAVLSSLAKEVVSLEVDAALARQASANLSAMGIRNVKVVSGPLTDGWKVGASYDVVTINGGVEVIPEVLFEQLAEGGRLVAILRQYGPSHASHVGELRLYEKRYGVISSRVVANASVSLLSDFMKPQIFSFK